jgi:AcrR family transcriptional regulator
MANPKRDPKSSRFDILAAAVQVIVRDGIQSLTIDAVAAEANLSKGGVLYHFPSKDALVREMLAYCLGEFQLQLESRVAVDPHPQGRFLRAFLSMLAPTIAPDDGSPVAGLAPSQQRRLHAAFIAAVIANPELVSDVKPFFVWIREQATLDGLPPDEAVSIWAAADGLWFWDVLGIGSLDDALRAQTIDRLIARTYPVRVHAATVLAKDSSS